LKLQKTQALSQELADSEEVPQGVGSWAYRLTVSPSTKGRSSAVLAMESAFRI